jgi:hypothetical protein
MRRAKTDQGFDVAIPLAYIIAGAVFVAGWHGFNVLIMIFVVMYAFWVYPVRRKR